MIELRHLRYFIAVAEELNFRRAAERIHIDPTPLSRTIRDLGDVSQWDGRPHPQRHQSATVKVSSTT